MTLANAEGSLSERVSKCFFLVDIEKLKLNIRRMRAFNEVVLEMSSPVWDFTWETWGFEK